MRNWFPWSGPWASLLTRFHSHSVTSVLWGFLEATWSVMLTSLWWLIECGLVRFHFLNLSVLNSDMVNINRHNSLHKNSLGCLFFRDFIYLFLERGEGREKEREISMCGCLSCGPHSGLGLQPRHVPWLGIEPATLWFAAHAQSAELRQPGLGSLMMSLSVSFRSQDLNIWHLLL